MASNTMTIEMLPCQPQPAALLLTKNQGIPVPENSVAPREPIPTPDQNLSTVNIRDAFGLPGPNADGVVETLHKWNNPRINIWRLAAISFAFLNFGMNDASYGALIPYIEADYHLSYTVTSLVFLSPFVGYTLSALFSDRVHVYSGRRGISIIAASTKLIAYIVLSVHPPYPAVVAILAVAGVGNGLLDAAWNAWIGEMDHANQLLGLLHGCYGLGATISPLIATAMVAKYGLGWWQFYYLMAGLLAVELITSTTAFWSETGSKYRAKNKEGGGAQTGMTRRALRQKVTWIIAVFLLAYVGCEVSLGGWIVTFMIRIRHSQPFPSGLTATGFWLGITVGRVVLGFVTPKIGERLAITIYLTCACGFELLFWLVPQFIVSAIAVSIVGLFIGPLFPSAVVVATKLLPRELHVAAIGFASAVGGGGAAVLPFAVGAIAEAKGVQTLQPIILALLLLLLGIWLTIPRLPKHEHQT